MQVSRRLESRQDNNSAARAAAKAAMEKEFSKTNPAKPKPLAGCPLMRNPPAHMHPSNYIPPNSRGPEAMMLSGATGTLQSSTNFNVMIRNANTATGGATGGDGAAITTLKADLLAVQSEIDGMTGGAGMLDLQSSLIRFAWNPSDANSNQISVMTLQSLLLLKLNEAAKVQNSMEGISAAGPPQSRISDVLTLLRRRRASKKQPQAELPNAQIARTAAAAAGVAPLQPHAFDAPDWTVHKGSTAPPSTTHKNSQLQALPTPMHQLARSSNDEFGFNVERGRLPELSSARLTPVNGATASLTLHPMMQEAQLPNANRASTPISFHTQLEESRDLIRQLKKQLSLFQYLEKHIFAIDYFDNALRTALLNPALQELGLGDLRSVIESSIPAHTMHKDGRFKSAVAPSAVPLMDASTKHHTNASPEASTMGRKPLKPDSTEGVGAEAGDEAHGSAPSAASTERETAVVASLRSVIAFQNAVLQVLVDELRARSTRRSQSRGRPRSTQQGSRSGETAVLASGSGVGGDDPQSPTSRQSQRLSESSQSKNKRGVSPDSHARPDSAQSDAAATDLTEFDYERQSALLEDLRHKCARLEKALELQREQLQIEREAHATQSDRTANLLSILPRARTTTPSGQTRLLSADPPVSQLSASAANRPLSRLHVGMPSTSNAAILNGLLPLPYSRTPDPFGGTEVKRLGTAGGFLRPPGTSPVLATSQQELDGIEKSLLRTIQDQANIIRDLQAQQRAHTAPSESSNGMGPPP